MGALADRAWEDLHRSLTSMYLPLLHTRTAWGDADSAETSDVTIIFVETTLEANSHICISFTFSSSGDLDACIMFLEKHLYSGVELS